ncbi:hypothetical protein IGI04_009813 [Brassica rapa subsp. trilocularis]|uniref:Uncharacterized protein n=1 Tax=Brassica rapa subsp. trilocularis TaxID=1813537 RepID=A0ABQ7N1Q4_BRACM|nr:hypothetical protein IGI04_009813 [Brassica rapa subsp. trilocularis]
MQLYLSTTNITSSKTLQAKPGSVPCPPCRYNIVFFTKQQHHQEQELYVLELLCSSDVLDTAQSSTLTTIVICKPVVSRTSSRTSHISLGGSDVDEPQRRLMNGSYSRSGLWFRQWTTKAAGKRSWFSTLNDCVTTGGSTC